MIIDSLKAMKEKYQKAGKKKYKGEIQILNKAIRRIQNLEDEIARYEKEKQKSLFGAIDKY